MIQLKLFKRKNIKSLIDVYFVRFLIFSLLLLVNVSAKADSFTFDGSAVAGCSNSGTSYICDSSPSTMSDTVTIAAGYTITGSITASTLTMAANTTISGSVTTATTITMATYGVISGNVSAGTTLTLAASANIGGNVSAGTTITLAANSYLLGNVNAGTTITLGANSFVTGSLTTPNATFGAGSCIGGDYNIQQETNTDPIPCSPSHRMTFLTGVIIVAPYWDPINAFSNPKLTPGSQYNAALTITNFGGTAVDSTALIITNPVPINTQLYVGNLAGQGPVNFIDGSPPTQLTYNFNGYSSSNNSIVFSNDNGMSWSYIPQPDTFGYDGAITHFRITPSGSMPAATSDTSSPNFRIEYRLKII